MDPASEFVRAFEVDRHDFRTTRVVTASLRELAPGQVRLGIERFALTTNNITYAVAGDMLDYWGFFPAEAPWGRLPAMGLATVAESAHPDIAVGGRYFGFYPMSTDVVIQAAPRGTGFWDVGDHRANHAASYTHFSDVAHDPTFQPDRADEYLLLRGLFTTSFLADDYLADNGFLCAEQTLVTSASSKTSICLAACLAQRADQRSIGLTSPRNRPFVEGLGLYDEVLSYDEIDRLDPAVPSALVDMAGSAPVRAAVHTHFAEQLTISLTIGATHWEDTGGSARLPGPKPEFFFAPGQVAKRTAEWGADELNARIGRSFHRFLDDTERWLTVEHRTGPDAIEDVYRTLLEGDAAPNVGYVVSMREGLLS
ncbi:MAG: DUF2855 family protein [Ilumatobacteraceae bacterium]